MKEQVRLAELSFNVRFHQARTSAVESTNRPLRVKCCPFAAARVASRDRPVDQLVRDASPILRSDSDFDDSGAFFRAGIIA